MFGLLIPGGPVHMQFAPVDASGLKFALQLQCPGDLPMPLFSVTDIVFFLAPNAVLPPDHGVLCYWQIEVQQQQQPSPAVEEGAAGSTVFGFELLGAVTPSRPSSIFSTGWSENEQVIQTCSLNVPLVVNIGLSVEPLSAVANMGAVNKNEGRLFVAQKIASDLFRYMQSFDTGAGGAGQMVVPTNIFDRWFQRFTNRFRRDPNFFLKGDES